MAFYQLYKEQIIKAEIEELWNFVSSPKNLKEITPGYMGFEITSKDLPEKMYPGMIISYNVRPLLGVNMQWVTEITHIKELIYFVDEQRIGPYTMWHHQHILEKVEEGILMKDIVSYKPPFGFLGSLMNALIIKKQLENIFDYRKQVLNKIFA